MLHFCILWLLKSESRHHNTFFIFRGTISVFTLTFTFSGINFIALVTVITEDDKYLDRGKQLYETSL